MYLALMFLPFFGFLLTSLFGRYFGPKGSALLTTSGLFLSFIFSLATFFEVSLRNSCVYIDLGTWVKSETLVVCWGFMFDSLATTMCVIITFVSALVHLYSIEYMAHDPHLPRFMSYLSLFTFFMLVLVTADNFVQMFLGWEGVGLCSYLLINFWFTRVQANKAAIKAMVVNRVGDFFLMIGIILISVKYKAIDYASVASLTPLINNNEKLNFLTLEFGTLNLICFFLFLGAMGKSAQLGLHTWLPDAMEGPTPVSALIHAATMVTAGVFLITRCSFLYEYAKGVLNFVSLVGALTAFFASSVGVVQNDLKRIIAYSTCSQLGYMIFACGLSDYSAGIFHLSNHAFFKALLFLSAGSVIHAVSDEQDIRKMGALKFYIPFTYSSMLVGSLALTGFPFLAGFYSKDFILELSFSKFTTTGHYGYLLGSLGAFLTAFYSTRLLCLTFFVKPNGFKQVICYASETFGTMFMVLGILVFPSIFMGYLSKDFFAGIGSGSFGDSIYTHPHEFHVFDAEFSTYFMKVLPLILSLLGSLSAFYLYYVQRKLLFNLKMSRLGMKIYVFLNRKWFIDKIYNDTFGQFLFNWGYYTSYKQMDRGVFEMLGPYGFSSVVLKAAYHTHKLQSLSLYHYLLIITTIFSIILLVNFMLISSSIDLRLILPSIMFLLYVCDPDEDDVKNLGR